MKRPAALALLCALVPACKPDLNQRTDLVTTPRVLAVSAEPAEAAPGAKLTLSALYVDANGALTAGPFDWALCNERKPLAELGPVSPLCAKVAGDWFTELGAAPEVTATMPAGACRLFGPEVPPPEPNQPPGRPVDPDSTGGYYQPVRLVAGDQVALLRARIGCDPGNVDPVSLGILKQRYHANANPQVDTVSEAKRGPLPFDPGGTVSAHAGERLELRAAWADCDPAAKACTGSEGYPAYDVTSQAIVDRREQIRVSWFSTGGTFDADTTGRDPSDVTPFTENGWTAPQVAGTFHVWVVVRDDRGGSSWRSLVIVVA